MNPFSIFILALLPCASFADAEKPNIIVIVADDQGYAELGCYGCKDVPTPNIDRLAGSGVRMTDGYVSCPVCSPTRAGIMTGRYQQRFGHEFNPQEARSAPLDFGLPLTEVTLANRLKAAGYATGIVGKWHLGYAPRFHPLQRGFDEYFGFLGGASAYLDGDGERPQEPILRGTKRVKEPEYLTDAFTREAIDFIERHKQQPFFLYLAYNAVHGPLQATPKYLDRFNDIGDKKRHTFAGMLSALDDGVGAVIGKLAEAGLESNTLIFYVSDNGGPTPVTTSSNAPLRGYKGQVLEGGIRTPAMIRWKGRLPAGKVYSQPVISLDIVPTAVAAAGIKLTEADKLDGVNLLPYLTDENTQPPHDALFWRYGEQMAVRKGQWKLIKVAGKPVELYDLASDIGEVHNLAKQTPKMVEQLQAALRQWDAQLAKPRWGGSFQPPWLEKAKGTPQRPRKGA
jgi:arylsulfatase A-like enzyme